MKKFFILLILLQSFTSNTFSQSFTVHDLVSLTGMNAADIKSYMDKKNYILNTDTDSINPSSTSYIQKIRGRKMHIDTFKSIDLYEKKPIKYFVLHTSSIMDYNEGRQWLVKDKFVYDTRMDISKSSSVAFERSNVTVISSQEKKDSFTIYTFMLKLKPAPDSIVFAEDLLQFTSREYLTSYFGKKNVTDDLYYVTDKHTKKCSVLMSGTPYQAVFVWNDEVNFDSLAYIMISNNLPTKTGKEQGEMQGSVSSWKYRCGLHWGMNLKELLRLNQMDFSIYGNKSDYAMMVKPEITGNINFAKIGIMMNCSDCETNEIFSQVEMSALEAAKAKIPLKAADIILYP